MSLSSETIARVESWMHDDPDEVTKNQTQTLLEAARQSDSNAIALLNTYFGPILQFGTAGLRGPLGPGPSCMNRAVVARAAAGLCKYLLNNGRKKLIVGYDARHNSYRFALDTVEIASGFGIDALLLPKALPTPVLSFAIRYYQADAGVMVTASHNPAGDNGYKVYLGDGSQIIPPVDGEIAQEIDAVFSAQDLVRKTSFTVLGNEAVDAYIERTASLVHSDISRTINVVSTSLHGVGDEVWQRVFQEAGFSSLSVVESQQQPDPDFPTVEFPNPEEKGATDLLLELAHKANADIAIAHDPDADRCAAAIVENGNWRLLKGDELGSLLAWWMVKRREHFNLRPLQGTFASSIVSSTLLESIADKYDLNYQSTLTGFKWISKISDLVFGYEEALGYCVDPEGVRDKDGISAALLVVELAAFLKSQALSMSDVLYQLAEEFGVYQTDQLSVRVANLELIPQAIRRIRETPPALVAGLKVLEVIDLQSGWRHLPPTNGMMLLLDGGRVIARPSGTEPKLKCYLEVVIKNMNVSDARLQATTLLDDMKRDMAIALGITE